MSIIKSQNWPDYNRLLKTGNRETWTTQPHGSHILANSPCELVVTSPDLVELLRVNLLQIAETIKRACLLVQVRLVLQH